MLRITKIVTMCVLILYLIFLLLFVQDSHKYSGIVEDCCCDYETVDSINGAVLNPLLQELVTTPFFRYFKVWYIFIFLPVQHFFNGLTTV